ncbi:Uncharacterized protein APZ42_031898 [Daphnia magna]|uniref:Uncharacterized protein n=1 Tax=Daphnia magna TaxID=35525 RepID=A0A0P5SRU8_9CRUS|nr:Uncharacterized protein APZ42_031898 [Daphnia magna]
MAPGTPGWGTTKTTIGLQLMLLYRHASLFFPFSLYLCLFYAPLSDRKRKKNGMNYRTHQFRLFLVRRTPPVFW